MQALTGRVLLQRWAGTSTTQFDAVQLPWPAVLQGCQSSSSSSSSSDTRAVDESHLLGDDFPPDEGQQQQQHDAPPVVDKQQVLRQLIRQAHAAEAVMAQVLAGQQLALRGRPDAAAFAAQEAEALAQVTQLLPRHRVRPSALLSALRAAGLAAGAAAALAPPRARDAVIGALQESLTGLYNDQLRTLREMGLTDEVPDVRAVLLRLRDLERAAEGAPLPPDLISLQLSGAQAIGAAGVVGALVKAAADAAVAAAGKV